MKEESNRGLFEALSVLDEAFKEGNSVKTGLIALLRKYKVPMANETAVTLRKKGWVCNDKDKETGKMSYIFWNGPRVTEALCIGVREETLSRRRKEKSKLKKRKASLDIENEIIVAEAKLLELQEQMREQQIIINYLKSKR